MKVSIIVPVYNLEKYIARCLNSLLKQTYEDIEIILVDDGSTDNSSQICNEYVNKDNRVKYYYKENGGVSSARNFGIEVACGDYVMFVDGDDEITYDAINNLIENIQSNGTDICLADRYYYGNNLLLIANEVVKNDIVDKQQAISFHLRFCFSSSVWLFIAKAQIVKQCKFSENVHHLEDWQFIFCLLQYVNKISVYHNAYYYYYINPGSASHSSMNDRKMTAFLIPNELKKFYSDEEFKIVKSELLCNILLHIVKVAVRDKTEKKYIKQFKKIARENISVCLKSKNITKKNKLLMILLTISYNLFKILFNLKNKRR